MGRWICVGINVLAGSHPVTYPSRFLSHAVTDRCRRTLAREIVVDESSRWRPGDIGKKMEGKKMEFAAKAIRQNIQAALSIE